MRLKMPFLSWLWSPLVSALLIAVPAFGEDGKAASTTAEKKPDAETAAPSKEDYWANPKNWHAAQPASALLPGKVMRLRLIYNGASGDTGWDSSGAKVSNGIAVNVGATVFVAEYGITDNLTVQLYAPFIMKNEGGLDAATFRNSQIYKDNYNEFLDGAAALLQTNGVCADYATCRAKIDGGYALPVDTAVPLPSGEVVIAKRDVPLNQYADALVTNAAKQASGSTGMGDVEIGAAYNILKEGPVLFTVGLGLRLPTGSFEDVPAAQRTTGSGWTSLGLRTYIDLPIIPGFLISSEHQFEKTLTTATRKKSSLVDPTVLNTADATTASAIAAGGDGKKDNEYKRTGMRHVGSLKAKFALGLITRALFQAGVSAGLEYTLNPATTVNGKDDTPATSQRWYILGASYDMLPKGIPLRLLYDYVTPQGGKEITVTTTQHRLQLQAFYKF